MHHGSTHHLHISSHQPPNAAFRGILSPPAAGPEGGGKSGPVTHVLPLPLHTGPPLPHTCTYPPPITPAAVTHRCRLSWHLPRPTGAHSRRRRARHTPRSPAAAAHHTLPTGAPSEATARRRRRLRAPTQRRRRRVEGDDTARQAGYLAGITSPEAIDT